jgi:ribosome modulation factor
MKKLYAVLLPIALLPLGGCERVKQIIGIQPPMDEWPVVIEIRNDMAVGIPISPDAANRPDHVGTLYDPDSFEFEQARIMANLAIESEKMDKLGYKAGLAGENRGTMPRPCSCAGENAWTSAWRRGRVDGGHWVP